MGEWAEQKKKLLKASSQLQSMVVIDSMFEYKNETEKVKERDRDRKSENGKGSKSSFGSISTWEQYTVCRCENCHKNANDGYLMWKKQNLIVWL